MSVVALLPIPSLLRLQAALSRRREVLSCVGVSDVVLAVSQRGARAVVVDPEQVTRTALFEIAAAATRQGAALVVFAPLNRSTVQLLLDLDAEVELRLVLRGVEDESELLVHAVMPDDEGPAIALVRRQLVPKICRLPRPLSTKVLSIYCGVPVPRRAAHILEAKEFSRRTSERLLLSVGLNSSTRLLRCARLTRAWDNVVAAPSLSHADAAEMAGYGSERMLFSDAKSLLGMSLFAARRAMRSVEFAAAVAKAAIRE